MTHSELSFLPAVLEVSQMCCWHYGHRRQPRSGARVKGALSERWHNGGRRVRFPGVSYPLCSRECERDKDGWAVPMNRVDNFVAIPRGIGDREMQLTCGSLKRLDDFAGQNKMPKRRKTTCPRLLQQIGKARKLLTMVACFQRLCGFCLPVLVLSELRISVWIARWSGVSDVLFELLIYSECSASC